MQRIECHKFCESRPDWEIIGEITEEGVSGFKKSEKQRDGLQKAKGNLRKHRFQKNQP
jgi:hypothetical protein